MFKKPIIAMLLSMGLAGAAQASVVTFSYLSTNANYDVIADMERGREYLRFNTFDLTYAQAVAATQVGGQYEGWSIASSDISDDFINALFSRSGEK